MSWIKLSLLLQKVLQTHLFFRCGSSGTAETYQSRTGAMAMVQVPRATTKARICAGRYRHSLETNQSSTEPVMWNDTHSARARNVAVPASANTHRSSRNTHTHQCSTAWSSVATSLSHRRTCIYLQKCLGPGGSHIPSVRVKICLSYAHLFSFLAPSNIQFSGAF